MSVAVPLQHMAGKSLAVRHSTTANMGTLIEGNDC